MTHSRYYRHPELCSPRERAMKDPQGEQLQSVVTGIAFALGIVDFEVDVAPL